MPELTAKPSCSANLIRSLFHSFNFFSFSPFHQSKTLDIPPGQGFILLIKHGEIYQQGREEHRLMPGVYFGTPHYQYRKLESETGAELLWLVLKPAALYRLSGKTISPFFDEIYPLSHILSLELDHFSMHFNFLSPQSLRKWLQTELLDNLSLYPIPECVEKGLQAFYSFNNNLSIAALCEELNVNRRSFERKFRQVIGISPKHFWKVHRVRYAMDLLKYSHKVDLQDIVFQCGYFDQSHFIRDFKHLTGSSPGKYLSAIQ